MRFTIQVHQKYILTFVYILIFHFNNICWCACDSTCDPPLWSWECEDEKCISVKAVNVSTLQSLDTCKMICTPMPLWPEPTIAISLAASAVSVRSQLFHLQIVSTPSSITRTHLKYAYKLFHRDLIILENNVRTIEQGQNTVIIRIDVISDGDSRMRLDTNEGYSLSIQSSLKSNETIVNIKSQSFCGARHALETLLQLIWLDSYKGSLMMLETAKIDDAPRFRYRGILIDTGHTYFPMEELMQNIDAMGASKLNTLHWHMSDSQAFPFLTESVPKLAQYGLLAPKAIYTTRDVKRLVNRARIRGIRVLIEIDTPAHVGHAWSFGSSMGLRSLINCLDAEPWNKYCREPPCSQLNPRNQHVYDLLSRLYAEIIKLTKVDDIVHLGGSEISQQCWMEHFNDMSPSDLWLEYTISLLGRLKSVMTGGNLPNLTMFWSSTLSEQFKKDLKMYIENIGIQIRNVTWSQKYFSGIRTVFSHEDYWDFNTGHGTWYDDNNGAQYNSWQRVYEHRPWTKQTMGVVEGGEAAVWSFVLREGGLMPRVWPRAAALAERLWTDRAEGATHSVHARLDVHRSRLVARGIQASPIWSMWCTQNPHTCA